MTTAFTGEELQVNLRQIINERNLLRLEIRHAKSAMIELENQNKEYSHLLSTALEQLEACKAKPERSTFAIIALTNSRMPDGASS